MLVSTEPVAFVTLSLPELSDLIQNATTAAFAIFAEKDARLPHEGVYYTRKQLTKVVHLTEDAIQRMTKDGKIPSYNLGGRVLYKIQEVDAALKPNFYKNTDNQYINDN